MADQLLDYSFKEFCCEGEELPKGGAQTCGCFKWEKEYLENNRGCRTIALIRSEETETFKRQKSRAG